MSLLSSVWLPGDDPTVHSNTSLPRRRLLNCTPHPTHVDRGRQSQRGTHYSAGAESYFILRCTCYVFTPGTSPASTDPAYFRRTAFTLSTIISAEKHSVLSRGETNDSLPAALPEVMSVFDPPWAQLRCRTERVALLCPLQQHELVDGDIAQVVSETDGVSLTVVLCTDESTAKCRHCGGNGHLQDRGVVLVVARRVVCAALAATIASYR